jgi:hypothetical protein
MARKSLVINLGLLLLVGLLGWRLQLSISQFKTDNDIGKIQPVRDVRQSIKLDGGIPAQPVRKQVGTAEFSVIPDQNLFSDLRARETATETPAVAEAPKLNPRPILVGVTIVGDQKYAGIIDPSGAPAGRGRTQTKRIGDVYLGYTITDIKSNEMILEYGASREIIPLFDTTKPRGQAGKTPIIATRVINFSPGGASAAPGVTPSGTIAPNTAGLARVLAGTGTSPTPQPATSTVIGAQPGAATPPQGPGRAPQGQSRQVPGNQQPTTFNERIDEQGRRILRTPFGDIPRDRPPNPNP